MIFFSRALLTALILLLSSNLRCSLPTSRKPPLAWENYDLQDGLGAPAYESSKHLEPLPIEDGVLCNDIAISRADGRDILWVGTASPLLRSTDMGATWEILEESIASFQYQGLIRVDDSGGIWVATRCSILHSPDQGATWTTVYEHPSCCAGINSMEILDDTLWVAASEVCRVVMIDVATGTATVAYTGSEWIERILPTTDGAVYFSTQSGLYKSEPEEHGTAFHHFYGSHLYQSLVEVDGTIWCTDDSGTLTAVSPAGDLVWQGGVGCGVLKYEPGSHLIWGLDRSQSALVLFDIVGHDVVKRVELPTTRVGALYIDDSGAVFLSLPGRIAYSTDQGETWTQCIVGISTVTCIAARYDQAWAGISGIGASRFLQAQKRWETVPTGIGSGIGSILIRSENDILFFIGYEAAVARTTDGGATFTMPFYDAPAGETERSYGCQSCCEDASGRIYICANAWSWDHLQSWIWVYWSDDFGATWSSPDCLYHDPTFPRWPEIALDEKKQTLWVTSAVGLFSSSVGSGQWVKEEGFGYTENPLVDGSGRRYVVGEGPSGWGLYTSQGSSHSWTCRYLPPSRSFDTSLVIDADGGFWYAADTGVHYSDDGGLTWYSYTTADGLASNYVNSIAVEGSGTSRVLWVGTVLGVSRGTIAGN